jgi:antitoxin VapB
MTATNPKPNPQEAASSSTAPKTAKLFKNGRSQAVRLPKEFRFEGTEVAIRRDPATGEVVIAPVAAQPTVSLDDFMADRRAHAARSSWQDLFADWDALASSDDAPLERSQTPPIERDFF